MAEEKVQHKEEAVAPSPSHLEDLDTFKQVERRLVRKIDMRIIPWVAILYLMLSLDRNNIGNARLGTLEEDLHLSGNDYYTALTIFFAGKS
ncbi:hypothetical protein LRAMOSA08736 [Lichtheimia ramosa]|uniref:Major facilitator superfamily (MFS) profile domain-containing protein n=1 Tax=Lichtheimia ramosa TaxID=688394 RepID=A0A077WGL5_9FUNG|nr:hypothetical protein LRAMOSA08736 [Lichtheimia ramosa]